MFNSGALGRASDLEKSFFTQLLPNTSSWLSFATS